LACGTRIIIFPADEFMMARRGIRLVEIREVEFRAGVDVEAVLDEEI
jgi:hypothetical protein